MNTTRKLKNGLGTFTYGRWGIGPKWLATFRFDHGYQEGTTKWFESYDDCIIWMDRLDSLELAAFIKELRA